MAQGVTDLASAFSTGVLSAFCKAANRSLFAAAVVVVASVVGGVAASVIVVIGVVGVVVAAPAAMLSRAASWFFGAWSTTILEIIYRIKRIFKHGLLNVAYHKHEATIF